MSRKGESGGGGETEFIVTNVNMKILINDNKKMSESE